MSAPRDETINNKLSKTISKLLIETPMDPDHYGYFAKDYEGLPQIDGNVVQDNQSKLFAAIYSERLFDSNNVPFMLNRLKEISNLIHFRPVNPPSKKTIANNLAEIITDYTTGTKKVTDFINDAKIIAEHESRIQIFKSYLYQDNKDHEASAENAKDRAARAQNEKKKDQDKAAIAISIYLPFLSNTQIILIGFLNILEMSCIEKTSTKKSHLLVSEIRNLLPLKNLLDPAQAKNLDEIIEKTLELINLNQELVNQSSKEIQKNIQLFKAKFETTRKKDSSSLHTRKFFATFNTPSELSESKGNSGKTPKLPGGDIRNNK